MGWETTIRDLPLQKINLNLIPVLRALLKEGSVSGAAKALGRSPSAVSEALSQLRSVLGDALFTRIGSGLQPTPRAAELAVPLEAMYQQLERFFVTGHFDPETSTHRFVIASSDYLICLLGPGLLKAVRSAAPRVSIQFVDVGRNLTDQMANREIDFALLPEFAIADLAPAPLRFQGWTPSHGVVVMVNRDHPLNSRPSVTQADLLDYTHIQFRPDDILMHKHRDKDTVVEGSALFDTAVYVSHYMAIPSLLKGTDLIAVVPRSLADLAPGHSELVTIDVGHPTRGPLGIAWSPVFDQDAAHQWFLRTVADHK